MGEHRLLCGDALIMADVKRVLAGARADLVVIDPPYNVNYEGATKDKLKIQNDQMADATFYQFLRMAQCCVWVKQTLVMGRQDYHWQHEPILYGWKPGAAHRWFTDRKQTTVWNFDKPARSTEHPDNETGGPDLVSDSQ